MNMIKAALVASALFAPIGAAQAGTYAFTVETGATGGQGFATTPHGASSAFTSITGTAAFTYTGPLNFNNPAAQNSGSSGDLNSTFFGTAVPAFPYGISGYSGTLNFAAESSFLAASGSAESYVYGSFYTIALGTLAAGTILTITHDDGVSVFQATDLGQTTEGPTSVTTDNVRITATGDTTLYYSRQNGTPSILQVSVPEPVSLSLLGAGLIGVGVARRRRNRAA